MNIKKLLPLATLFLLNILACKKTGGSNSIPKTPLDTDVYVAGFSTNGGAYWKNGVLTSLPGSFGDYNASVAISGKDIYAAGYSLSNGNSGTYVATIWKNGIETQLDEGGNYSEIGNLQMGNIIVNGSDVYTVGTELGLGTGIASSFFTAVYWKNNALVKLSDGSGNAYANAIAVNGSDVYVAGSNNADAAYWKNGNEVNLTNFNNPVPRSIASANCISISGGSVYIGGNTLAANGNTVAAYWKDGALVSLTDGSSNASILAIAINNNDVYVAGYVSSGLNTIATYWKNGVPTALADGTLYTKSIGIAIDGSDVYVTEQGSQPKSGYWKNNTFTPLNNCKSTSNIIVISK